ncbi:Defense protein 6 [Blattella germanica]|nr:Defense protein 6 [Blattella germanica]
MKAVIIAFLLFLSVTLGAVALEEKQGHARGPRDLTCIEKIPLVGKVNHALCAAYCISKGKKGGFCKGRDCNCHNQ